MKKFKIWKKSGKEFYAPFYLYATLLYIIFNTFLSPYRSSNYFRQKKIKLHFKKGLFIYMPFSDMYRFFGLFEEGLRSKIYSERYNKSFKSKLKFKRGSVVIDIGAHIGGFSIPLIVRNKEMRVFAFEPDHDNYSCIKESLKANRVNKNYIIERKVVYGTGGRKKFFRNLVSSGGSLKHSFRINSQYGSAIWINSITLDEIFKKYNISVCDLLKIDCEGSEYSIFRHASDKTLSKCKKIIVESHPVGKNNQKEIAKFLRRKGFTVKSFDNSPNVEYYCKR